MLATQTLEKPNFDTVWAALQEQSFYLIEPDGENFNITPPGDQSKEW